MSDLVIVSKSDIEALIRYAHDIGGMICTDQPKDTLKWVYIDDLRALLDQATPVNGEAVAMINFNEHEEYICMPVGREVFKLAPDVDHLLYTTPQPAPQIKDFDLAYTCKRIRRLLKLLNIPDPSPDNDEVLLGCLFSLLGTACGIIERQQPAPDTVPVEKYNRAIEALQYWREECSGYEPSISVFEQKVDKALAEAMKGEL